MMNNEQLLAAFRGETNSPVQVVVADKNTPVSDDPHVYVNTFSETSKEGFIRLHQEVSVDLEGIKTFKDNRYMSYQGHVSELIKIVDFYLKNGALPGRIREQHFLFSQVPQHLVSTCLKPHLYADGSKFKSDMTQDERIYMHSKKENWLKNAKMCTYKGEIIMRFWTWDKSGLLQDELIEHDGLVSFDQHFTGKSQNASSQFRMQRIRKI